MDFQPRVTNISLCAIGTPIKSPASPAAIRASAAFAWASVRSGSTLVKAFRSLCSIRVRKICANSVAEIFLSLSRPDNCLSVLVCMKKMCRNR